MVPISGKILSSRTHDFTYHPLRKILQVQPCSSLTVYTGVSENSEAQGLESWLKTYTTQHHKCRNCRRLINSMALMTWQVLTPEGWRCTSIVWPRILRIWSSKRIIEKWGILDEWKFLMVWNKGTLLRWYIYIKYTHQHIMTYWYVWSFPCKSRCHIYICIYINASYIMAKHYSSLLNLFLSISSTSKAWLVRHEARKWIFSSHGVMRYKPPCSVRHILLYTQAHGIPYCLGS